MPATEQTWRDQKLLHVVFGCSSLALLISTLWMLGADHLLEWKEHQRKLRGMETRLTGWQLTQAESDMRAEVSQIEGELLRARATVPDQSDIVKFKQLVQEDADRRDVRQYNFSELDANFDQLTTMVNGLAEGRSADSQEESPAGADTDGEPMAAAEGSAEEASTEGGLTEEGSAEREQLQSVAAQRSELLDEINGIVRSARFREDRLLGERKFKAADYDAARAKYDLAIGDDEPEEVQQDLLDRLNELKAELDGLTQQYQDAADHRKKLQEIQTRMTAEESQLIKELDDAQGEQKRLANALQERKATYFTSGFPLLGKKVLELPILDAFNSPLKIDNLWTQNLTIENGSFGRVRRFDRCTTCHQSIQKTTLGSATEPAYESEINVELSLTTPDSDPRQELENGQDGGSIESIYGFRIAKEGLLESEDVTIEHVAPNSLAAKARVVNNEHAVADGLRISDVLTAVNGNTVYSAADAHRMLVVSADWGQPVTVTVRRGMPHPYSSHPRLDLFVGSLSPHRLANMGCTICHDGQGSATSFKWASHTPDSPDEAIRWSREHGWFDNHHWIFPMNPKRFVESGCLKCHHGVVELEPSQQFPDPPAPKLTSGYHLIRRYGCFGCHEINGYDGPEKRVGPDIRLEPNYFAAAAQIKADDGLHALSEEVRDWIEQLIHHPERDDVRHRLHEFLTHDQASTSPVLSAASHKMAGVLEDVETPGLERKVGPSLRYVKSKLGKSFMYAWIRDPKNFRPSTRMPQFFGLWRHLESEDPAHIQLTKEHEAVEILGMVNYLLDRSQTWEGDSAASEVSADEAAERAARGRLLFETRCTACHQHNQFPNHVPVQAPDLSNIGDKFRLPDTPDARGWLYSWLKNPSNYHARTKMPNMLLETQVDSNGVQTDEIADLVEFLLVSSNGWQLPDDVDAALTVDEDNLRQLALEHLSQTFFKNDAKTYIERGIPEALLPSLKGAEVELVGEVTQDKLLRYVGSKAITKYGCFACHDIPGFEDAKPIGTAIADWGRKDPARLAFEHIAEYLHHGHAHGSGAAHGGSGESPPGQADHHGDAEHLAAAGFEESFDESFYRQRLQAHDRVGFIWQKLKEPRSYDYKKTVNKGYHERLRMPQFPFTPEERESVVTFVLGLVADPPATEFVYHPSPRRKAIIEGKKVLERFNCAGCHILEPETWHVEFQPDELRAARAAESFPFVQPQFTSEELANSAEIDAQRGVLRATLKGMPAVSDDDGLPVVLDDEGDPIEDDLSEYDPSTLQYRFDLWEPTIVDGEPYPVGALPVTVPQANITKKYPAEGGDLTLALYPRAVELEKQANPNAKGTEAWGWLPPPLVNEGNKVQFDWLHSFLLNPETIRPAVFLRMPKFNMSPDEATKLVNYFAAQDNADFPFEFNDRSQSGHVAAAEQAFRTNGGATVEMSRLDQAMKIVTDSNYCIKCHLVADFKPTGSERALAPDLSKAFRRLRPDYVRHWIANPKSILPYTAMPVNIEYRAEAPNLGGVSQDLYPGTSIQQLDAVVDLLMNYDRYTASHRLISPLVKQAAPAVDASVGSGASAGGGG